MGSATRLVACILLAAGSLLTSACERAQAPATPASAKSKAAPTDALASQTPWPDALGNVVIVPSPEDVSLFLFSRNQLPDSGVAIELFSHDDNTTTSTVRPATARDCPGSGTLAQDGPTRTTWSLGLLPGIATSLPMDAVSERSPRDSARLVAALAAAASALPEDAASEPFRGLPVVVRDAWMVRVPDDSVVIAVSMRSLNAESNPRSEATLLIAEWRREATGLSAVWSHRTAGPEDRVEGTDVLGTIRLKDGRLVVAVLREDDSGTQVEFVVRQNGDWRALWSSARRSCRA